MSILCEDVLENLRNATPCFMMVAHSGQCWASTCTRPISWVSRSGDENAMDAADMQSPKYLLRP